MRIPLLILTLALGLSTLVVAQKTFIIPATSATTEGGSSTSYPWNVNQPNGHRIQYCYDSSHFSATKPILIQRIRWRADGSTTATWTGVTHPNVKIDMSSATTDHSTLSTTFATNHGKDRSTVYTGKVVVAPSPSTGSTTPNIFYVDVQLSSPFFYDPSVGKDLLIDITLPGPWTKGTTSYYLDCEFANTSKVSRMFSYSDAKALTGTLQQNVGPVIEVTAAPAKGLYANFIADKTMGASPLTVKFTDKTYTSDPTGVKTWAWDFDGDNIIDSTVQNPVFTYKATAFDSYFDVSLTVTDKTHPKNTITKKQFIRVNPSTASNEDFGKGSFNKPAPSPIVMPNNTSHYIWKAVRGFHFAAPGPFLVNGFECPNDHATKQTDQTVSVYRLKAAPTLTGTTPTAAELVFHGTGKAGTILRPKTPIIFKKGDHFAILGACHSGATGHNYNSYGPGSWKTSVLNKPITCNRLVMQVDHKVNKGLGMIYDGRTGSIARVWVHVLGNTSQLVPELSSSARPILGTTPNLQFTGNLATAQAAILFLGVGRMPAPIPTPFGSLLIRLPFLMNVPIAGGKGDVPVPIPNSNSLKGVVLDWQGMVFDIRGGYYGMSNGTEWYLGTK
ncbi:MAG: hypothetical protein CSA62_10145 [Planctomycetota bacterium]|nr:MAG: hypothetical protein CSA62_10145 [Planctomycetota bacterium]